MTREQLVRVFPDGRTVHIPTDGRPLPGYELALADIRKRGASPSEMSIDAARSAGMQVAVAGVAHRSVNPFAKFLGLARDDEEEDANAVAAAPAATASSMPAPAAAEPLRTRAKAAVVAAIDRAEDKLARAEDKFAAEKTKFVQVAAKAEEKLAAEKTKFAQVAAKAHVISRAEAAPLAAPTPNQIILARGFWQGVPDGAAASRPAQAATNALAAVARPSRIDVASAATDSTGSIGPFAAPPDDRVSPDVALAYAEQADREATARTAAVQPAPVAAATPRAAVTRAVAVQTSDNEMTIAVKRVGGRPASAILTVANKMSAAPLTAGARVDDPWLRAIVLAPSVNRFLCITALGARDFRSLAALMVKPASSVMMTFSADPQLGLAQDHFSGSAIVFVSTVTYPMRTAELR
jgi:hypothetical protein